jgi:pimeloyl-ACP methyl ester carboxylesterase
MDALGLPRAVLAGYDRGGRAACVAAVLRPERCTGLVSVNGPRVHHQVPRAGHDLPQEAPAAFADAVLEAARLGARTGAAPD